MAKLLNHLELNSTGNIWAKKVSWEEESSKQFKTVNSGPVSRIHRKDFQKFYKDINIWEHIEQDIHEGGDTKKRKKVVNM